MGVTLEPDENEPRPAQHHPERAGVSKGAAPAWPHEAIGDDDGAPGATQTERTVEIRGAPPGHEPVAGRLHDEVPVPNGGPIHDKLPEPTVARATDALLSALDSVRANEEPKFHSMDRRLRQELSDVEFAVERFGVNLRVAAKLGLDDYPCLRIGHSEPVPIDALACLGYGKRPEYLLRGYTSYRSGHLSGSEPPVRGAGEKVELFHVDDVVQFFARLLTSFLGKRLERGVVPADCQFTVHTAKPGLRVHYAGRYFIRPDEVFGGPTSPVRRSIKPGIYVFGVYESASNSVRYSQAAYSVPEQECAQLVEF